MRELPLFPGLGGGLLATKHLLGWETVGYVEFNEYCQKALRQRIADGLLDAAPIFGDIRNFISEGYAKAYQGMVDVITGGFPCQAFSTAASGRNITEKDMWPETSEVIEIIQPHFFFGENTSREAIEWAGDALYELGYLSRAIEISASDMGADHIRKRYWILAYPYHESKLRSQVNAEVAFLPRIRPSIWESYPDESRMDDGNSNRVDRFKAIGNMQVPIVAATAWEILARERSGKDSGGSK